MSVPVSQLLPSLPFPFVVHTFVLYVSVSISALQIGSLPFFWNFPGGTDGKEPTCQCRRCKRHEFDPWVGKIPLRRAWQPTPVFLSGEFFGQRSLTDYSPLGSQRVGHDWSHLAGRCHFSRFHTYALIYNIFWLTSLCVTVSRSIHISTNGTISFLFMAK